MTDRGLKQRDGEVITLEQYWMLLFPEFEVPKECYLRGWLKRTSLDDVMLLMDQLKPRKFDDGQHLGRVISSMIRQIAEGQLVKVYPQDSE